jgi:predicted metalloprotease with PDZ domain
MGGETAGLLARVAALELGGVRFSDPIASIVPDAVDRAGQISGETLRRATITFDCSCNRMFLKPNRAARDPFESDMAGWYIVAGGSDLRDRVVFLVLEGSPAAKAGVQEGDRIVTVDGRRAQDMSLDEIRRLFQVEKAARRVRLARGDKMIEVTLTLRKLL